MCFIAHELEKLTAIEPVICYKQFRKVVTRRRKFRFWKCVLVFAVSMIRNYPYKAFEANPTIELDVAYWNYVEHVYNYYIKKGYHSYVNRPTKDKDITTVKCIIPTGSTYYTNGKEYVSSNIIITDEIV